MHNRVQKKIVHAGKIPESIRQDQKNAPLMSTLVYIIGFELKICLDKKENMS
jgi:hypothetical protein